MKFGILRNVAGNFEALKNADRLFDEFGVETKVCLGQIVGLYPYVDECIEYLVKQRYLSLRMHVEEEFVNDCRFVGWSLVHLIEAARYARSVASSQSVEFLRGLPLRLELDGIAFESRSGTSDGFIYKPEQVAAAFASWQPQVVIHSALFDPYVWREDLIGAYLSMGRNQLPAKGRLLISTGGVGCCYLGSIDTKQPAAIVFDTEDRTVHLLRPHCDLKKVFEGLRKSGYPKGPLEFLLRCEYETWRNVSA